MQQMYYCPYCNTPVAYGQAQCSYCKTALNWQGSQTQGQYQSSDSQYFQQQKQQQGYQSADGQSAGSKLPDGGQPSEGEDGPGLLQWIKDNRGLAIKISIGVLVLAALIVTGVALQGEIAKWFAPPVVTAFEASSPTIISGQDVTLQWDVSGATSVSISPGIGTVSSSGTKKMSPDETTTYKLTADSRFGGSVSREITVTVSGKPPTVNSFVASPGGIYAGQQSTLSWNVTGATSVSIQPEVGTVSPTGSKVVSPGTSTRYVLTAANSEGNSTASATLEVSTSKSPIITTFSASPMSISAGDESTLTWDIIGAKSININQGVGGVASKGAIKVTPSETSIYTLRADSDYGSVTKSVTVSVDTSGISTGPALTKDPPQIKTFAASSSTITLGDEVTLTWTVDAARTASISPAVGDVPSSGWIKVIPFATTTYVLFATNTFGTVSKEVDVSVSVSTDGVAPVIRSFTATPSSISHGDTSSLSWDIKGATRLFIDQGIGEPASKYGQTVSPVQTTSYTLTAINSYGTDNATRTVIVTGTP
jgi:hypothetical protein